jgi:hypothetical protein
MQTHKAKRVEIVIEVPLERRLTDALERPGSRATRSCRSWAARAARAAGAGRGRSGDRGWLR